MRFKEFKCKQNVECLHYLFWSKFITEGYSRCTVSYHMKKMHCCFSKGLYIIVIFRFDFPVIRQWTVVGVVGKGGHSTPAVPIEHYVDTGHRLWSEKGSATNQHHVMVADTVGALSEIINQIHAGLNAVQVFNMQDTMMK